MGALNFPIPAEDHVNLMQQMGIDPSGYAVVLENEDVIWLKHYKTGNELTIRKNRRAKCDN